MNVTPPSWLLEAMMQTDNGRMEKQPKRAPIRLGVTLCNALSKDLPLSRTLLQRRGGGAERARNSTVARKRKEQQQKKQRLAASLPFPKRNRGIRKTLLRSRRVVARATRQDFLQSAKESFRKYFKVVLTECQEQIVRALLHPSLRLEGAVVSCDDITQRAGVVVKDEDTKLVVESLQKGRGQRFVIYKRRAVKVSFLIPGPSTQRGLRDDEEGDGTFLRVQLRAHHFRR